MSSPYTYDYNRTEYMAEYYESRREELNELAKDRYRQKAIERTIAKKATIPKMKFQNGYCRQVREVADGQLLSGRLFRV